MRAMSLALGELLLWGRGSLLLENLVLTQQWAV